MRSLIYFLVLLGSTACFSQELFIPNNPYDNASDAVKERKAFQREKWFYEQRMFPNNFIPEDAYGKAYEQKMQMRSENGFYRDNMLSWIPLGPTPGFYFSWSNISGRTVTAAYDYTNPNTIYIGCAFGGVWKSTNAGANWQPKTDFTVSLSSGSIVLDPVNPNIIYYGTGEATYSIVSYYGRGILKSTDAGNTWTNYTAGLPSLTYCAKLLVRKDSNNVLLAAMGTSGFYRSTDAGANWIIVSAGRCDDVVASPTGDTVYIIGSGVSYRMSTDGGVNFTTLAGAGMVIGTRNQLAICRNSPNVLYSASYSGSSIRVFKSTNYGLNYTEPAPGTDFAGSQAWYDFYVHVNPVDPNYAYVGSIDIWRTTNGGANFLNISNGYTGGIVHVDQHNMAFHPTNPDVLIAVNDGGVWRSSNRGTDWQNLNSDISVTQFYRIASDPSNVSHILGGTQDNGTQRTLGTMNWAAAFGGDGGEVCFQSQNNLFMLGETQNNGVRRSNDGGTSWVNATNGLTGTGAWVGPLISHPTLPEIFYTARQQVFKTSNWGVVWEGISSGTGGVIRELAISKSNPDVMYAAAGSTMYRSTNGGLNFTNVNAGLPGRVITSVYIHPDSSNVALATFSGFGAGKIYKTTNGAANWVSISGNLPDSPVNDGMFYYPGFSTSTLLVAMDIGVFVTTDYGTTWSELADGLPNTVAMHLDYHNTTGKLRIGTHGRGTWEANGVIGIISYSSQIPGSYGLSQNYPNPFNPVTNIKYDLVNPGYVKLAVYDIMGREIETVVNQKQSAGTYIVQFDASRLASGVYFYTLRTNDFTATKKMIIAK
jgi:photosystem II stability/assembly factor-like uncharacterized protein